MGFKTCDHPSCPNVVEIHTKYCEGHEEEHVNDGKPRPRGEFKGKKCPVGLSGRSERDNKRRRQEKLAAMTPEEREAFLHEEQKEREKRDARRDALRAKRLNAQPAKGTSSGGGGGKQVTNPHSKKSKRKVKKEENRRRK
ncbi:MAG: hypothetical protein U9P90_00160 [Patescibacteria group bacterium]|nr:hypothetical protein [Patescibacteria group bacterium]